MVLFASARDGGAAGARSGAIGGTSVSSPSKRRCRSSWMRCSPPAAGSMR